MYNFIIKKDNKNISLNVWNFIIDNNINYGIEYNELKEKTKIYFEKNSLNEQDFENLTNYIKNLLLEMEIDKLKEEIRVLKNIIE